MNAPRRRRPRIHVVVGAVYVLAMAVLAGVAAWPIYRSVDFVVVAASAAAAGAGVAVVSRARRWPGWLVAATLAGAFLVLGVAFAVPSARSDLTRLPSALLDVVTGAVTGWKDLVTVALPVGSYRNLLVPALVVFLVGTFAALRLSWLRVRLAVFGAVVALGMLFFGLAFGRPATSDAIAVGPVVIAAPVELATGALGMVLSLGWLAWLALDERRHALRRAANTSGVRVSRRRTASDTRRGVLAGAMIAVAVVAAGVVAPAIAAERTRDVLRTGIGPDLEVARAESPLSVYRESFADSDAQTVLFRVSSDGALPDRVRIATLTAYDGSLYRALDRSSGVSEARFTRVPSSLDAGSGPQATVRITVDGLRGIWLPTVGKVERLAFEGTDAARLADAFYYNASTQAGVETARGGLAPGDTYVVTAVVPDEPDLAAIRPPGVSGATVDPPESLVSWVKAQGLGSDGAALAELITRLRERGYLSHALSVSDDEPPAWMQALPGYVFQPSASGHSLARIDAMFRQLLERESEVKAAGGRGSLVAAVGDDEQFSVAAALIAQQLGFPARVVLGMRLSGPDTGVPRCDDGECLAGDLTAWVEVQTSGGEWVAVDVTPQHAEGVETDVRQQRDPENETDVRPKSAREVVPPNPVQQENDRDDDPADAGAPDLSGLWTGLRWGSAGVLALALVLGPFLIVVGAKAWRRRSRRDEPDTAARVVGGWEEYVDAAVDHGLPAPRALTRVEIAGLHARPAAAGLAAVADRAVFSDAELDAREAEEFWRIVDAERRDLRTSRTLWRRLLAAVSLKSFTRSLAPRTGRGRAGSARRPERRMRRRGGGAQPS